MTNERRTQPLHGQRTNLPINYSFYKIIKKAINFFFITEIVHRIRNSHEFKMLKDIQSNS